MHFVLAFEWIHIYKYSHRDGFLKGIGISIKIFIPPLPNFHIITFSLTMRFQLSALTAAALLLRVARADFYIYSDVQYGPSDENGVAGRSSGYTFFNGPPSCDDVGNSIQQYGTDDASGGGVRCSGCGPGDAGADVSNPTLIEWNTKMGHFSKQTISWVLLFPFFFFVSCGIFSCRIWVV